MVLVMQSATLSTYGTIVGSRALYTIHETFVYRVSLFVYFNTQKYITMWLAKFAGTRKYIKNGIFYNI